MTTRARRALRAAGIAAAAPFASLFLAALLTPFPEALRESSPASVRVLDRRGHLLREVRAADGKRARPLTDAELGGPLSAAMIAAEDRRFWRHHGVDPLAIARAAVDSLAARRVVSGASTLTMQLARTVRPKPKTILGKFQEMALALRIEASLSKQEILRAYLERVDFGPSLRGAAAASHAIFDKPVASLSTAEAALLAGLPRGPSLYDVKKRPALAKKRRDRVIGRMEAAGSLTQLQADHARGEPLVPSRGAVPFGAPHLVRGLVGGDLRDQVPGLAGIGVPRVITTTIDPELQRVAENALRVHLEPLAAKNVTTGAVVVLENETGNVLAYVGSRDFFDEERLGQNDGVASPRQPGSTLKPFVYGLAMERLGYTAATVLPDVELHLQTPAGDFAPRNFDGKFHGPVRLRQALATSLNVPAVATAAALGPEIVLDRLHELGFDTLTEAASHYGPGLALGDGEVSLLALARAFSTLARDGEDLAPVLVTAAAGEAGELMVPAPVRRTVMPAAVAVVLTDILADAGAREAAFGEGEALRFDFDVAAKTGTSKGFRDNWTAGYTRPVTVAVWVGNFDGSPMAGVSGVTGAGPVFHAVMEAAMRGRDPKSLRLRAGQGLVSTSVCALSGERPHAACPQRIREWLPSEAESTLLDCGYHEHVRIERASGLRAGPSCGLAAAELRVFERFPLLYGEWPREAGRPIAPTASSVRCPLEAEPAVDDGPALRLEYPLPDGRFVLDPERDAVSQAVPVRLAGPRRLERVRLIVDDVEVAAAGPPFSLMLPLVVGTHVARLEGNDGSASEPIRFSVR